MRFLLEACRVGKDEIKTAGERYTPLCKDVHPRAIIDWISATDDEIGRYDQFFCSGCRLDRPNRSVSGSGLYCNICYWLVGVSCHWEGNEYSQAGEA